jgi:ribosome-associated protein
MSKTARPARTRTTGKPTAAKPAGRRRPVTKGASKKVVGKKVVGKKAAGKKTIGTKTSSKKATSARGPARRRAEFADKALRAATAKAPRAATPRLPADVKLAVAAALDKQAIDLTVLDLRTASAFTDFFIVCTGNNTKQVQAIADGIETILREAGQKPALVEGYRRGEWILLDYFSFIAHVFLPAQRTFYALERLWGGAEPIQVSAN